MVSLSARRTVFAAATALILLLGLLLSASLAMALGVGVPTEAQLRDGQLTTGGGLQNHGLDLLKVGGGADAVLCLPLGEECGP